VILTAWRLLFGVWNNELRPKLSEDSKQSDAVNDQMSDRTINKFLRGCDETVHTFRQKADKGTRPCYLSDLEELEQDLDTWLQYLFESLW
jgi:hypothetical protein